MKFKEIVDRISEINIPVFGVQWNPTESEIIKAQKILFYLESRQVLYAPEDLENTDHCVDSILKIREFLAIELEIIDYKVELAKNLRAMAAACSKFLNEMPEKQLGRATFPFEKFYSRLGILRGAFGIHIALIAAVYGLDVEDNLDSILPSQNEFADKKLAAAGFNNYL